MKGKGINPLIVELIEIENKFGGTKILGDTPEARRKNLKDILKKQRDKASEVLYDS